MSSNKRLPGSHWYSYLFLYGFLKPVLFLYFHLVQNVHFRSHGFKVPREPVLFIGNHATNWDGFYHCVMFYRRFPHFIVHDEAFISKGYARFFGDFLGQVPRARIQGDMAPVIAFKRLLAAGQSVNVYPEGDIAMFGTPLVIDDSIAKMALFLKAPIVLTRVRGAHLRAPRWSNLSHHSRITYEISDVISKEELDTMSVDTLHQRIASGIAVSAYEDQEIDNIRLWGGRRAEWIELGLFYCPACHAYESFTSRGNDFVCLNCGLVGHVDSYLRLSLSEPGYPRRLDEWDTLQRLNLKDKILTVTPDQRLFTLADGSLEMVPVEAHFSKRGKACQASIYRDRIEISSGDALTSISLSAIIEAKVQYKDVFEFITRDARFRLWRRTPKWSAYLWANCVNIIKKI